MTRLKRIGAAVDPGNSPGLTTTLIVLALIAGSVILTWAGKVNGDAFVALASTIVGGVLVTRGIASSSNTQPGPPPPD